MIVYNSHNCSSLIRVSGSVFPVALKWAAASGIAAGILKILEKQHMPVGMLGDLEINASAFNGFSFTLGFVIVFRTSQCYNRFWTCSNEVNSMRAQWYEAASGLTSFIAMSNKSLEQQELFQHKVIRYFSLLHSLALQALADGDDAFPVIDLESLPQESLDLVIQCGTNSAGMTERVEMVYQWIQSLIVSSMASGLLNIPPPILTRVLQQMTNGMVAYNSVLDIMGIPFPFPYAQVTLILLTFYVCFVPIVMCLLVKEAWIACICGFLSVLCLISVDLVSTEIENPFGEDANDLPCHEFQDKMNKSLLNLLHPAASDPPNLCDGAFLSYQALMENSANFTIVDVAGKKFHGGKLKPAPPAGSGSPPIPEVKERKSKPATAQGSQGAAGQPQPQGTAGGDGGQQPANQLATQDGDAARERETALVGRMVQQSTMLAEFTQNNGLMLQKMDSTLNTLSTALTNQLSCIQELQAFEADRANAGRTKSMAGETLPPCLSWMSLLSTPSGPTRTAPSPPAAVPATGPNVIVQPVR